MAPDAETLGAFWGARQRELAATLQDAVPAGSTVAMLDYQVHGNTGDQLIMLGTQRWASLSGLNVVGRFHVDNFPYPRLPADTILVWHGGGNFGDLYRYQRHREKVSKAYPRNRIVVLPQTVFFQSEKNLARSSAALNAHPDLHLFVRDRESLRTAERHFSGCHPTLAADMATFLFPLEETIGCAPSTPIDREVLLIQRRDRERVDRGGTPELRGHKRHDWSDLHVGHTPLIYSVVVAAFVLGRLIPEEPMARWWYEFARRRAVRVAGEIRRSRVVVTDRLHAHILASLLGVPSVVLDNSYGKNAPYYRCWHSSLNFARLVELPR